MQRQAYMPDPGAAELSFVSVELAAELARWRAQLSTQRRLSANTVEAYERDVSQFLRFLSQHLGSEVTLDLLSALQPLDVRAFLAARRSDGISSRSLMRMLAGSRSFARFLERDGKATVAALFMIRTPRPNA